MSASGKPIVVLGLITRMPVAGAIWQTLHYLLGLRRLGYDVHYVEAHGITPVHFMDGPEDDGAAKAAAFLDRLLRRFDFDGRWAYHAINHGGRHFGMSERRLKQLYRSAELLINLHGGTMPLPEHTETGRLVCLETDPVELEVELHDGYWRAVEFAAAHRSSFSTWALNYGNPDCRVPLPEGNRLPPRRRPPILLDLWEHDVPPRNDVFTTVGNWRQHLHVVTFEGEVYTWSKHSEFLKFLDLPGSCSRDLRAGTRRDADGGTESCSSRTAGRYDRPLSLSRTSTRIAATSVASQRRIHRCQGPERAAP